MTLDETIQTLVRLALDEDLGERGDITSKATIAVDARIRGKIFAKAPGVIAGLAAAKAVYQCVDPNVVFEPQIEDGSLVVP